VILKKSSRTVHPENVDPAEGLTTISRLKEKILADNERSVRLTASLSPGPELRTGFHGLYR
jgi:hypothetical protein